MTIPIRPVPAPIVALEPQVIAGCGNDRVSIEWLDDEAVRISNPWGHATITKDDIPALRDALLDADQQPRLTFRFNDAEPHHITETVSIAIGNDGEFVIAVGPRAEPCETVELGIGDLGLVVRALSC